MRPILLPTLVGLVVLAGCTGGDESADTQSPPADRTTDQRQATATGVSEATSRSDPIPADARRVTVTATDYAFQPDRITVQAGETVALTLVNEGSHDHAIELHLDGSERESDQVAPGERTTLVFQAPTAPGSYTTYCPIEDHRERGMTGTLAVSENPSGAATDTM